MKKIFLGLMVFLFLPAALSLAQSNPVVHPNKTPPPSMQEVRPAPPAPPMLYAYTPPVISLDRQHAPPTLVIDNRNNYEIKVTVHCEGVSLKEKKFYSKSVTYIVSSGISRHSFPINVYYWQHVMCW